MICEAMIRQDRDDPEEERADQRDPGQHPLQIDRGVLARPHARDERALPLQVLRNLLLLEDHHRVEEGEADHHEEVDQVVLEACSD